MKRLTIYAFYDPDGLVDDYVVDCVAAISEYSDRVLIVSNGAVEAESASRLTAVPSVELVERANEGFDIWGYKHGLELVGWDELARYDEVVLMNSTIAGPLYPLSEMFDAMDAQDLAFWGLTTHAGEDYDPWDLLPTGKIERHIQSYFTVIRNVLLQSPEFRAYWDSLPLIRSYTEAVALHETVFTHKFGELGFRWASYVDGTDLEDITSYPLMFLPEQVLLEKRCPFFKRRALFLPAPDLAATYATSTTAMLQCLNSLGYDLKRVLPRVIRTNHQSDVRLALNTFETLASVSESDSMNLSKVRVVARVKDVESAIALERFRPVLEQCGEFVIVTARSLEGPAFERVADFKARVVSGSFTEFVREVGRNARTADHLLVFGCTGTLSELNAYSQYETGLRALIGSDTALAAAVAHLESSALAGGLASPLTNIRFDMWSADWREAGVPLDTALPLLGIDVPLSPEKSAWGPLAGIVLAAPGMLAADWDVIANMMSTMPEPKAESLFTSLIPFILQSNDRLLVFAAPQQMAATGVFANYLQQALRIGQSTQHKQTTRVARVYHNAGAGYIEEEAIAVRPRHNGAGSVTFSWQAPPAVESVRFDPVEGAGVICRGVTAMVDGAPVDIVPFNCLRFGGGLDVFITPDSIYDLRGVTPGANVVVTMDRIDYIDPADFAPPLPESDPNSFGGPLSPALAAAQAELNALREERDALREARTIRLEVRLRRRARAVIAKVRARARGQRNGHERA